MWVDVIIIDVEDVYWRQLS